MRRSSLRIEAMLTAVIVAGCGSNSLDIGSNDGGVAADVAPDVPQRPLLLLGRDAGDTTQVWIGHLVKDQFPDGSNTLTMTIDFADDGQVSGSILLGDGARLAPPTDPDVGYPPGNTGAVTLVEGFPYTIVKGSVEAAHLAVQFSEYEVWAQWCALQTPHPDLPCIGSACSDAAVPLFYDCLAPPPGADGPKASKTWGPSGCGYTFPDGGFLAVDCGKFQLCGGMYMVCECSAADCHARDADEDPVSLDLVLTDSKASGGLSGPFGDYPVQFTRSQ